jgi:hypothetical protein
VSDRFDEWGLDHVVPSAQLVVSELAANAVLHARTPFTVAVELVGDCVRVSVSDRSPIPPQAKRTTASAATGRGLALVAAIAGEHGVERTDHGKRVWVDLPLSGETEETLLDWSADIDDLDDLGVPDLDMTSAPDDLVTVRILDFPLLLWVRAQEHQDDLVREFTLIALDPDTTESRRSVPASFLTLVEAVSRRYGGTTVAADVTRDDALARGERSVDLDYVVPPAARAAALDLGAMLDLADEFCRSEHLLTLETPLVARRFRDWFLGEFVAQIDGAAPTPWRGPFEWPPSSGK